ncbi:uncharacterized protein VTP21DRAFT_9834 [Calcarisporiella thermophila]|uniref:uncharacterized protein n=1 Tax=Calcarisporiella thermophila TaxID=911321 RepID=UPI0037443C5E
MPTIPFLSQLRPQNTFSASIDKPVPPLPPSIDELPRPRPPSHRIHRISVDNNETSFVGDRGNSFMSDVSRALPHIQLSPTINARSSSLIHSSPRASLDIRSPDTNGRPQSSRAFMNTEVGVLSPSPAAMSSVLMGFPSQQDSSSVLNSTLRQTDDLLIQLQISQAAADAKEFAILSLEEVEELKKDHAMLIGRIATLTARLAIETKIQDAAVALTKLHANHRKLLKQANEQLAAANRKTEQVASELARLTQRESDVQKQLLQHMAGVLGLGVRRLEEQLRQAKDQATGMNGYGDTHQEVDMKEKIKYLNNLIVHLQSAVSDSEKKVTARDHEIDALKSQLKSYMLNGTVESQLEEKERIIAELRSELEEVGTSLDMLQRLQHRQQECENCKNLVKEGAGLELTDDCDNETRWSCGLQSVTADSGVELSCSNDAGSPNIQQRFADLQEAFNHLQAQLAASRTHAQELENELERRSEKYSPDSLHSLVQQTLVETGQVSQDQEIRQYKERIEELEQELNAFKLEAQNNIRRSSDNFSDSLKDRLYEADEMRSELSGQLQSTMTTLRSLFSEISTNIPEKEGQNEEFSLELFAARVRQQLDEKQFLMDRVMELQSVAEDFAAYRADVEHKQSDNGKAEAELRNARAHIEDLEQRIRVVESEREIIQCALERTAAQVTEREAARSFRESSGSTQGHQSDALRELETEISARNEQIKQLRIERDGLQAEFDYLQNEFERLTAYLTSRDAEEQSDMAMISSLQSRVEELEMSLTSEKIRNLNITEDMSTTSLRREFRKLLAELKDEHAQVLEREREQKSQLEERIREMRREQEVKMWGKVTRGIQTL